MSTFAAVLIALAVVFALLVAGGLIAASRRQRANEGHLLEVVGRANEALAQAAAALRKDLEAGGDPRPRGAVEHEHPAAIRTACGGDGRQRVGERGGGERRRLLGRAGRRQAGLHPAGLGRLGDDEERRAH